MGEQGDSLSVFDSWKSAAEIADCDSFAANTLFVVYLEVEEQVESEKRQKIKFRRSIKTAECVPMTEILVKFETIFGSKPQPSAIDGAALNRYALARSFIGLGDGILRIAIVDKCPLGSRSAFFDGFPTEYNELASELARAQMPPDGDWLKHFKEQVDLYSNNDAWKGPVRQKTFQAWVNKHQNRCISAGMHALDLRKQPSQNGEWDLYGHYTTYLQTVIDTHVSQSSLIARKKSSRKPAEYPGSTIQCAKPKPFPWRMWRKF